MAAKRAPKKLALYRAKRDFKKTSEPSGVGPSSAAGNSYLIQKHAARRLHYDFRLEMDGVLKSWAVTKGPSLDPNTKRLAVHVEDHPLDYGSFEGTIPQGQYGGGTVMLWDNGRWEPVGDPHRSYKKGNMTFLLHGKRLKGRWHLVRMHGRPKEKRENWLLIKGKDQYANEDGDYALTHFQKSVTSGRSMEDIAGKSKKVWISEPDKPVKKTTVKKPVVKKHRSFGVPNFVPPQLATLVTRPPKTEGWVHEVKFDGYRLLARLDGGEVRLITRANNDWTHKFKPLAEALARLKIDGAILDGEVVHRAADGTMSFHGLQNALSKGRPEELHYYVFDLLFLHGEDLRPKTLVERKTELKKLLAKAPSHIHYSEHFDEPGEKVLEHACHIALEGIVSKRADRPYASGRGESWLKSKCTREQEVVIGGFTMQPKHPSLLGALLTGYFDKGKFIFSGKCGTGYSNQEGQMLLKKMKALQQKTSPFAKIPAAARRGALWVRPELVAQVHFTEWTPDGSLRHPSYQGLREDKPAEEVVREKEKPLPAVKSPKKAVTSGKTVIAGITLSHPDKVLYPDVGITKKDIALYYEKAAPWILPHIKNRPISLLRCPQGEGHTCFFQRHGSETLSPHVKPVRVKSKSHHEPYIMIEDVKGLIALVQMDVLEVHVWGSRADEPEKPDRLVFDLDPAPDVKFETVKEAAANVRERLKKLGLVSFLKTTGGKGLHIVVPFTRGPTWDEAKNFARAFSEAMAKEAPKSFTINSRKEKRVGKIFIDYLRNGLSASAVAPYSTRSKPGAPIALPLAWKELPKLKSAHGVTLRDFRGVTKDPWGEMGKIKQKLPRF